MVNMAHLPTKLQSQPNFVQGSGTRKVANFRWNELKFHVKQPPRVAARLPVTEFVLPPANLAINDE